MGLGGVLPSPSWVVDVSRATIVCPAPRLAAFWAASMAASGMDAADVHLNPSKKWGSATARKSGEVAKKHSLASLIDVASRVQPISDDAERHQTEMSRRQLNDLDAWLQRRMGTHPRSAAKRAGETENRRGVCARPFCWLILEQFLMRIRELTNKKLV